MCKTMFVSDALSNLNKTQDTIRVLTYTTYKMSENWWAPLWEWYARAGNAIQRLCIPPDSSDKAHFERIESMWRSIQRHEQSWE